MISITISPEAYRAIAREALPQASRARGGGYVLWLTEGVLNRLRAVRRPSEDYSQTIIRLAQEEA